jgi:hypothetical protein
MNWTVTEYEQHQLDMLLWQADVHERNGRKQEAFRDQGVGYRFSERAIGGGAMRDNINVIAFVSERRASCGFMGHAAFSFVGHAGKR